MPTQEILSTILIPVQPADVFLTTLAALVFCKEGPFDSIWDLSNRVCDRYLPQMGARESPIP
jgi:hypothetical protein